MYLYKNILINSSIITAGCEKYADVTVLDRAIHISYSWVLMQRQLKTNGHTQGVSHGKVQREGLGCELTWCLMEHWIRSIHQPASVRDSPASASAAHDGLPWINNGGSVGAPVLLTTTEIGFSVTGLQGSVSWMMNCFYWAVKAFFFTPQENYSRSMSTELKQDDISWLAFSFLSNITPLRVVVAASAAFFFFFFAGFQ